MILHVMGLDKFIQPFISFTNEKIDNTNKDIFFVISKVKISQSMIWIKNQEIKEYFSEDNCLQQLKKNI